MSHTITSLMFFALFVMLSVGACREDELITNRLMVSLAIVCSLLFLRSLSYNDR